MKSVCEVTFAVDLSTPCPQCRLLRLRVLHPLGGHEVVIPVTWLMDEELDER